ncbi:MAG: hypothetical protein NUV57_01745 [archaeon]|nr:hypothetical protein [archaeon]
MSESLFQRGSITLENGVYPVRRGFLRSALLKTTANLSHMYPEIISRGASLKWKMRPLGGGKKEMFVTISEGNYKSVKEMLDSIKILISNAKQVARQKGADSIYFHDLEISPSNLKGFGLQLVKERVVKQPGGAVFSEYGIGGVGVEGHETEVLKYDYVRLL